MSYKAETDLLFLNFCGKTCIELSKIRIASKEDSATSLSDANSLKILKNEIIAKSASESAVNKLFEFVLSKKSNYDLERMKDELAELEYIFCDYEDKYSDVAYILLKSYKRVCKSQLNDSGPKKQRHQIQIENQTIWFLSKLWIISDKLLFIKETEDELLAKRSKLKNKEDVAEGLAFEIVKSNRAIVDDLVHLIVKNLDLNNKPTILYFMASLAKEILNKMDKPIMLADFFIARFDKSGDEEIQTDSLWNLLTLMGNHSQEYDNYYTKLYALLTSSNFVSNNKFQKILEMSLRTKKISELTLASFIKGITRKAMFSQPREIFGYMGLLMNLFKRNDYLRTYCESRVEMYDVYLKDESQLNCKANDSKQFELTSIDKHYQTEVSNLAKGLRQNLQESDYLDQSDFNNINYNKLIKGSISNFGNE